MEEKWSIKKVLESQGDMHEKVVNQSNSELPSSSPTQSPGPPCIQINLQIAYDLHFKWNWSNVQLKSESSAINKTVLISRTIFDAASLFWPDGPYIQLESIRDVS
jgi:hypothetical protein